MILIFSHPRDDPIETVLHAGWKDIPEGKKGASEEPARKALVPKRIFISWCESNPQNPKLVEDLLDPFLSALGFEVHYYRKDKKLGAPEEVIWSTMDQCELFISLYTKDRCGSAAGNVVRETGRMLEKAPNNTVIFCERGVNIESLTYPKVLCIGFDRYRHGKLLLDLVVLLKNNGLLKIQRKRRP